MIRASGTAEAGLFHLNSPTREMGSHYFPPSLPHTGGLESQLEAGCAWKVTASPPPQSKQVGWKEDPQGQRPGARSQALAGCPHQSLPLTYTKKRGVGWI